MGEAERLEDKTERGGDQEKDDKEWKLKDRRRSKERQEKKGQRK